MTTVTNILPKPFSLRGIAPTTDRVTVAANLPTVSRRLTVLVLTTVLPVLAFSGFMIVRYSQVQRTQYEHQLHDTTRATMAAIDAAVSSKVAVLATLSHTSELRNRNWRAFYDLAKSVVADQPTARITLYDPSGHVLLATFLPFGTDFPTSGSPEAIRTVVTTAQPYVTNLYLGAASQELVVAAYVPVIEDGAVVNALSLAMPPAFISRILQGQLTNSGAVGAVFDRDAKLIGQTKRDGDFVGQKAVPGYVEALQKSDEGTLEVRNLEGFPVRSVYIKSTMSGWSTTLAVENAELDAPLWQSLWIFGGGGGLLFAVAILLSVYIGRSIVTPLTNLSVMAESLGRGDRLPQTNLRLREPQVVAIQMILAADALHRQSDERDHLLATLEQRVEERTHELEVSTAMYRQLASYARSLLEASLDPLVTISRDGIITDVNNATELATERPRDLLVGSDFASYFTEPEKARAGYRRVLIEGFVAGYPLVLRGASGRLIEVAYNASTYRNESGEIAGIFAAARDVTTRKRAERELRDYQDSLEETVKARTTELTESNEHLEAANKELEGFSYSVSHDLRTPLRAIDGFSRKLMDNYASKLDQEGLRLLDVVRGNTLKMSRLIDDILDFSRIGRLELRLAVVDMAEMARTIYKELEPALAGRSIELRVAALPKASADAAMMKRVFINLLDNAIKYSAPNEKALIEVEGYTENDEAVYVIRDNGVGFDMKYVAKLFGVFQRLHGPAEFSGTGIGLSIVKRIITRHGGRVWAEGKTDHGASFYFTLPQSEASNA